MAEVQITIQDADASGKPIKVISFAGQLDETNVDEEAKKIYQVIDENEIPYLLLDFSELAYMNSKSIGYVTDWYSRIAGKNGQVVITRPRANILDILKVVGITQIINIYDSIEEAKLSLGSGTTPVPEAPVVPEVPVEPAPVPEAPVVPEVPVEPAPAPEAPVVPEVPVEPTPVPEAPVVPEVPVEPTPVPEAPVVPEVPVEPAPAPEAPVVPPTA